MCKQLSYCVLFCAFFPLLLLIKFIYVFSTLTVVSPPSSPLLPSSHLLSTPHPNPFLLFLFKEEQASHGCQQSMMCQVGLSSPLVLTLGKANQYEEQVPGSHPKQQGQALLPPLEVLKVDQATQRSHIHRGLKSVLCSFPVVSTGSVSKILPTQASCFYGFPCDDLDPPGLYTPSSPSSSGFLELSPELFCGSLIFFPSVTE